MNQYPKTGDIILINFNPQSGHEIQKRRPAIVVSNDTFNRLTGMAMVCPITSTQRNIPLHIKLDSRSKTHGDILCEQLKSLDYEARQWQFLETAPQDILDAVLETIDNIIGK